VPRTIAPRTPPAVTPDYWSEDEPEETSDVAYAAEGDEADDAPPASKDLDDSGKPITYDPVEMAAKSPATVVHKDKGRTTVIPEWLPGFVRSKIAESNCRREGYSRQANMVNLTAELLYWAEPDKMGIPKAEGKRIVFVADPEGPCVNARTGERGHFFVRLKYREIEKRHAVTRWVARRALQTAVEIEIVAVMKFGKGDLWARPRYEVMVDYVHKWLADTHARRAKVRAWKHSRSKECA
jgi:hypothetical protein